jgi:dihydropteroate synthase
VNLNNALVWQAGRFRIDLKQARVMGIVNITPDSFSDGGAHADTASALRHCEALLAQGAHILDIGGESTRPGSLAVPLEIERERVLSVLREAVKFGVPLSVDTSKPELMREVLDAGADIVNDIWALRQPGALDAVAQHPACGVCLVHMHGDPRTMQVAPMDGDALVQVSQFLRERLAALGAAGIAADRVVLDPGIGFGKTVAQNFALLARQIELQSLERPLLLGWSRKSALGAVTGIARARERISPSVAAALLAVERGARIVRVHDVRETVEALAVWQAMCQQNKPV